MTEQSLGQCGRIVDEASELVCGKPAVAEVLVRTKWSLAVVQLCVEDAEAHREFYKQLNARTGRRRRWRNQKPGGYESESTPALRSNSTPGRRSGKPDASSTEVRRPGA